MINLLRPHKLALPDATALVQQMQTGVRSAEAIVTAHLDRLQALHPMLNAATQVWRQRALDEARQPRPGPLSGLPCSVKETFGLAGETVTAGSLVMAPEWHAEDAVVVQKLRDAGAIIVARSNVPEFAMTGESTNLRYGRTNNPLDPRRVAGGSSGGEGALVGSGSSVFGVGSDILGSIRIPSAFCGIVGFKPASEAVDKTGTWPVITGFTDSWLAIGPLARSVRDIRLIYDVIAHQPLPVAGSVRGLRVLAPEQFPFRVQQPCIRQALVAAEQALLTAGMTREAPAFPAVRRLTFDAPLLILHELEADWYRLLSPPGRPAFNIWAET